MTLTTHEGNVDVLDRVAGVGAFADTLAHAVEVDGFDVRFPVLDLPELIRAKRAAGRPKDIAQLPELEALAALRKKLRKLGKCNRTLVTATPGWVEPRYPNE